MMYVYNNIQYWMGGWVGRWVRVLHAWSNQFTHVNM